MSADFRGEPREKGLLSVSNAFSFGMMRDTVSRPKPVPIRPTWTRPPSRLTPAMSDRKAPPLVT